MMFGDEFTIQGDFGGVAIPVGAAIMGCMRDYAWENGCELIPTGELRKHMISCYTGTKVMMDETMLRDTLARMHEKGLIVRAGDLWAPVRWKRQQ